MNEDRQAQFKPLSHSPTQWTQPIISGGLERFGPQSYAGKGFYVGSLWQTHLVFALQGQFGLYEGKTTISHYSKWQEWTLVYNKTAPESEAVKFYIKGVFVAAAQKIHSTPCDQLPATFADFLVIGSWYGTHSRRSHVAFYGIKFWSYPLLERHVTETYETSILQLIYFTFRLCYIFHQALRNAVLWILTGKRYPTNP